MLSAGFAKSIVSAIFDARLVSLWPPPTFKAGDLRNALNVARW